MKDFDVEEVLEDIISNEMSEYDLVVLYNKYCDYCGEEHTKILNNDSYVIDEHFSGDSAYEIITHIDEYDETDPYITFANGYLKSLYDVCDVATDFSSYARFWAANPYETDELISKYEDNIITAFSEFCEEEYGIKSEFVYENVCADEIVRDWEEVAERMKDEYSAKD